MYRMCVATHIGELVVAALVGMALFGNKEPVSLLKHNFNNFPQAALSLMQVDPASTARATAPQQPTTALKQLMTALNQPTTTLQQLTTALKQLSTVAGFHRPWQ